MLFEGSKVLLLYFGGVLSCSLPPRLQKGNTRQLQGVPLVLERHHKQEQLGCLLPALPPPARSGVLQMRCYCSVVTNGGLAGGYCSLAQIGAVPAALPGYRAHPLASPSPGNYGRDPVLFKRPHRLLVLSQGLLELIDKPIFSVVMN